MRPILLVVSLLCVAASQASAAFETLTRTVYVAVVDDKGSPVRDLTAADFTVKEGERQCPVVEARLASPPMQIAIVVDDDASGMFREGTDFFVSKLLGQAEFAIITVIDRPRLATDFTTREDALRDAVGRLGRRQAPRDGTFLLLGISEASDDLRKRHAQRPVIVVLTVGGTDNSTLQSSVVLRQLQQSQALFHVVSLTSALTHDVRMAKPYTDEAMNLNDVLDNGPKQTGGRRTEINRNADLQAALGKLVDQLNSQYAISYSLPNRVRLSERLVVTVKKPRTTVLAATTIPER